MPSQHETKTVKTCNLTTWTIRTLLRQIKNRCNIVCSGRGLDPASHVELIVLLNPVITLDWGKYRIMIITNEHIPGSLWHRYYVALPKLWWLTKSKQYFTVAIWFTINMINSCNEKYILILHGLSNIVSTLLTLCPIKGGFLVVLV